MHLDTKDDIIRNTEQEAKGANRLKTNELTNALKAVETEKEQCRKTGNRLSTLRLLTAAIAVIGFIGGLKSLGNLYYGLGFIGAILFILLLFKYGQNTNQLAYLEQKEQVLHRYQARLTDQWKTFAEDGSAFLRAEDALSNDLDIFGHASLYQYLSVAHTIHGQQALAKAFTAPQFTSAQLQSRQEAVQELAKHFPLAVHFEAISAGISNRKQYLTQESIENFLKYGEHDSDSLPLWIKSAAYALPIATFAAIGLSVLGLISGIWAAVGICAQLALTMLYYGQATAVLEPLFSLRHCISAYQELFQIIEKETFTSSHLQFLQNKLTSNGGASAGLKQLHRIGEIVNLRYNILLYWPACSLLMWNFQALLALEKWKSAHGKNMRGWLESVGEFEELLSLAVLVQVKENICYPTIIDSNKPYFASEQLAHPLIEATKAVANSIALQGQTCVITGSNMSGKTTFLRSIGINLVLAYAGGAVCAQKIETSIMKVFTSMRVHDDVSQGISTFYAEILRIKTMVQYCANHQPMLVLIDEIFKGTNSADRLIGATAVVRRLSQNWVITLVSTHDFELCDLEKDPQIKAVNYHFSEHYVDNEIRFDYLIAPGRCQTTNAQQLLRMAGIM